MEGARAFEHLHISDAALGKFDVRDDEEQLIKRASCIELLISAASIPSPFPRLQIVGGLVWCISLCAHSVDVDLLYSENSTIGQKIALTEKISEALPKLGCPGALEPHQIQGLDCIHIFPVLEWLVKEVSFTKTKRGDEQENFAVYRFAKKGWRLQDDTDEGVRPMVKSRRKIYRRVVRMQDGKKSEGVLSAQEIASSQSTDLPESLIICEADGGFYAGTTSGDSIRTPVEPSGNVLSAEDRIAMLREHLVELDSEIERTEERLQTIETDSRRIKEQVTSYDEIVERVDKRQLTLLKSLLAEKDEIKANETAFKRECRKRLGELDNQISRLEELKRLEEGGDNEAQANTGDSELSAGREVMLSKMRQLAHELKSLERDIFTAERLLESQPTQAELNQYQKRFVELYNQIASKHVELKRQYNTYNTLVDVKEFMKREIDLLNGIDDLRQTAAREAYKDSFVANIQKISQSVDESLDGMLNKKRAVQQQNDALAERLQSMMDRQRLYAKMVVEFQEECLRNENLQKQLQSNE